MKEKLMGVEIVGGILAIVVFSGLAYMAISERAISLGRRGGGISHASGANAVWTGLVFVGMSLFVLGYLLRFARHKALYWCALMLVWFGFAGWQLWLGF